MQFIAFIIIFGVIVLVHEFGHFYFAKKSGILVREFGDWDGPKILHMWQGWHSLYHSNSPAWGLCPDGRMGRGLDRDQDRNAGQSDLESRGNRRSD